MGSLCHPFEKDVFVIPKEKKLWLYFACINRSRIPLLSDAIDTMPISGELKMFMEDFASGLVSEKSKMGDHYEYESE